MRSDNNSIVQFVFFETTLRSEQFITQWEQFAKSANSGLDVTLQLSGKEGAYKYIAQHRYASGEFKFVFSKAGRSGRFPEVEIRAKQAGGYANLQMERSDDAHRDESKVFAFIIQPQADLDIYKQLNAHSKLNIYEAYYENCQYAYVLEFFLKNKYAEELVKQLEQTGAAEIGLYKEYALQTA
jgi:hypothetical protein